MNPILSQRARQNESRETCLTPAQPPNPEPSGPAPAAPMPSAAADAAVSAAVSGW